MHVLPPPHAVSQVLGQGSAIDAVYQVIRMMSQHSFVIVTSNDVTCAEVVAEVAANWVSRLLGEACVIHLASCSNSAEAKAVHLWICMLCDDMLLSGCATLRVKLLVQHSVLFMVDLSQFVIACSSSQLRPGLKKASSGSTLLRVPAYQCLGGLPWDTKLACSHTSCLSSYTPMSA